MSRSEKLIRPNTSRRWSAPSIRWMNAKDYSYLSSHQEDDHRACNLLNFGHPFGHTRKGEQGLPSHESQRLQQTAKNRPETKRIDEKEKNSTVEICGKCSLRVARRFMAVWRPLFAPWSNSGENLSDAFGPSLSLSQDERSKIYPPCHPQARTFRRRAMRVEIKEGRNFSPWLIWRAPLSHVQTLR